MPIFGQPVEHRGATGGGQSLDDRSPVTTTDVGVLSLPVDASQVSKVLLAAVAVLLALGSLLPLPIYRNWVAPENWPLTVVARLFDLDGEANIPALFSAMQLLLCGMVLAIIASLSWRGRNRWRFHWALLAGGFVFMAFDEAAQLHERLIRPGMWIAGRMGVEDPHYGVWVPIALVLLVPIAAVFMPFLLALPARIAALMSVAAVLFLSGALGLEAIGASVSSAGVERIAYHGLVVIEEGLEMAAITLFLFVLLRVLATSVKSEHFGIEIRVLRR